MNPIATFLLESCFWSLFDKGIAAENSPLFTGIFEGNSLPEILCHRFGISGAEAEFEIKAARSEVQL